MVAFLLRLAGVVLIITAAAVVWRPASILLAGVACLVAGNEADK